MDKKPSTWVKVPGLDLTEEKPQLEECTCQASDRETSRRALGYLNYEDFKGPQNVTEGEILNQKGEWGQHFPPKLTIEDQDENQAKTTCRKENAPKPPLKSQNGKLGRSQERPLGNPKPEINKFYKLTRSQNWR